MLVEVPDSMAGEIPAIVAKHAEETEAAAKRQAEIDRLNNETDLSWIHGYAGPLARESCYKDSRTIPNNHYLFDYLACRGVNDPPVIMKGSRYSLHRRYCKGNYGGSCANGWHERVAARYVRMSKITCFFQATWPNEDKQVDRKYAAIRKKIQKKFAYRGFDNPLDRMRAFYINGKEIWHLDWRDQEKVKAMKSLYKHVTKIENVDKQINRICNA